MAFYRLRAESQLLSEIFTDARTQHTALKPQSTNNGKTTGPAFSIKTEPPTLSTDVGLTEVIAGGLRQESPHCRQVFAFWLGCPFRGYG